MTESLIKIGHAQKKNLPVVLTKSQTRLEQILVALEHIEARGSLLLFAPGHMQRALLRTEHAALKAEAKRFIDDYSAFLNKVYKYLQN